jgi:hypothetical protein
MRTANLLRSPGSMQAVCDCLRKTKHAISRANELSSLLDFFQQVGGIHLGFWDFSFNF